MTRLPKEDRSSRLSLRHLCFFRMVWIGDRGVAEHEAQKRLILWLSSRVIFDYGHFGFANFDFLPTLILSAQAT